jgi:hypothetical protein
MKNATNQKAIAIALISALLGGGSLLPVQASANSAAPAPLVQSLNNVKLDAAYSDAIERLIEKGVLQGYGNGDIRPNNNVSNAELIKMVLLALEVEAEPASQGSGARWYDAYIASAVEHGLLAGADELVPNDSATTSSLTGLIAKALQRDAKSVAYWMEQLSINSADGLTRGETAALLVSAEQGIRSADAEIVSVKALNRITLEVTFDAPLALEDETTAAASENFKFDGDLGLVNQPRLKTGSFATYIVPVKTMTEDSYSLSYKGKQSFEIDSNHDLLVLNNVRQVTADTIEAVSSREDGIIDYGYMISAYAGGRGANAVILDEENRLNGKPMSIISSLATRKATLTPEAGEPIEVSYVGFTQSTDGKQEPKFRLPQGQTLKSAVRYTLTSDWFELKENEFVASEFQPLTIASAEAQDEKTLLVTLSEDPGDELFAYRSVQLKGADGSVLTAQYKVQTRKGATGTFEIQNDGKLTAGVAYEVVPVGNWSVSEQVTVTLDN